MSNGLVGDSKRREAGAWRAGEFPEDCRLFCRRRGEDRCCSGDPKLKDTGAPKPIRLEDEDCCAELGSRDDEVERDQRFRLPTPSVPVSLSLRGSGGVTRCELEDLSKPLGGNCGVGWPRLLERDVNAVMDGGRWSVGVELLKGEGVLLLLFSSMELKGTWGSIVPSRFNVALADPCIPPALILRCTLPSPKYH